VSAWAAVSNLSWRHPNRKCLFLRNNRGVYSVETAWRIEAHGPSSGSAEAETVIFLPVSYRHVSWWISRMLPKDSQSHHSHTPGAVTRRLLSRAAIVAGLDAIFVLGVSIITLTLWEYDLRVPFDYRSDTLWFAVLVKGMLQNGWTFNVPQLSAPYGLDAAAFPAMTNFDWGLMKIIGLFVSDAGVVLNLFWLLSMVLSCWTATVSLRLLGVSSWLSRVGGVLFAFLPFAWLRHTLHIVLTYYCVPLLCLLAIHLVHSGAPGDRESRLVRGVGYAGCLIQGFNYLYFSFFAVLLFISAGVFGYARHRVRATIRTAVTAIVIVVGATLVNLAPSLQSWYEHGKPPGMEYKILPEAEYYGAKIRKMLAPHPRNPVPILAAWGTRDSNAGFPNENENRSARLGPYGALGFLLLLAVSMSVKRDVGNDASQLLRSTATLTLFTLLTITVGGFGAVLNVIMGPEIRAYNRFSIFLAFFSIAGLSLCADARVRGASRTLTKWGLVAVVSAVAGLSLVDQLYDGRDLATSQREDMNSAVHERAIVAQLERYLPVGSGVFELPVTVFPADAGVERMGMYDHARPYLWSQNLRWSWPSFSQRHRAWLGRIETLQGVAFLRALALSGFGAIWVDRFGYADGGKQIMQGLVDAGATSVPLGVSSRYAAFDIQGVGRQLRYSLGEARFEAQATDLLRGGVTVEWGEGFHGAERTSDGTDFRWARAQSQMLVRNLDTRAQVVHLAFAVASHGAGVLDIRGGGVRMEAPLSSAPSETVIEIRLAPGEIKRIDFTARAPRVKASGDTRELYFQVLRLRLSHIVVSD
jgi:phosphoglycerol transferase